MCDAEFEAVSGENRRVSTLSTERPQPTDWQLDIMAYQMFRHSMSGYELDEGAVLVAWADPGVSVFWRDQAENAVTFLFDALDTSQPIE
jgi:hypothetical protein